MSKIVNITSIQKRVKLNQKVKKRLKVNIIIHEKRAKNEYIAKLQKEKGKKGQVNIIK